MRRKVEDRIHRWLASDTHEPLLLKGARRVGKTYLVTEFLRKEIGANNLVYLDFQTDLKQMERLFSGRTEVNRIIDDISIYTSQTIDPDHSVIVFDEVQLCEKALNSLRFFAQSPYKVIATGSLLGVTLKKSQENLTTERALPFPSDVQHVTVHPMDFEEFLWALDKAAMAEGIRRCFREDRPFMLHAEAMEIYRSYLVVGGMPKAVAAFTAKHSVHQAMQLTIQQIMQRVREIQSEINETYISDMPSAQAALCRGVWDSIPKQLTRETSRKFKYGDVVKGARAGAFAEPLAWLVAAGIISVTPQTNSTDAPLIARDGGAFFKAYMADTGLMFYKYGLMPATFLDDETYRNLSSAVRGALAENYVMQALVANNENPFYWTPKDASGEIEFVVNDRRGSVLPIEVKSGRNVKSISLKKYMAKTKCPLGIRISSREFGREGNLKSVPLYAAFCIDLEGEEGLLP